MSKPIDDVDGEWARKGRIMRYVSLSDSVFNFICANVTAKSAIAIKQTVCQILGLLNRPYYFETPTQ